MSERHGLVADTLAFSCVDGPGNRFVVFLQGCSFDCVACHNPQTIPLRSSRAREVSVADLVDEIRGPAPFLSGVTVSGGEPTCQAPFVGELFAALGADATLARLTRFVDTNGSAPAVTWDALAPVMEGAMVDLKAFDPGAHHFLTGQPNDAVLASITHLVELERLHEVRLLIVPGVNDGADVLARTGGWLASVGAGGRVVVQGFRHHGVRRAGRTLAEATAADLARAADALRAGGVHPVVRSGGHDDPLAAPVHESEASSEHAGTLP